ncbi:MAG TPA: ADOP family duplicated permease [Gemmatimonadaceae bacterium]|nr:ADOP family duplicated permease [Gemmatimonadaceae bacterium]
MTLREILGRLSAWRRRDELGHQLAEDMHAHIELLARDLRQDGLSPDEARAAARRQVGNVTRALEESRDAWGFPRVDVVVGDLRYAARGLRRAPGFTTTVVVTLALGIGANAAMFGVIDRLMFRPFAYLRDPATVNRVYLQSTYRGRTTTSTTFPYRRFLDLSRMTSTAAMVAAESQWRFGVGEGEATRIRHVAGVSASYFDFFDATPVVGRFFGRAEDVPPVGAAVAVISHELWTTDFGRRDVIGRRLKVGMIPYTIIGVAPPGFRGTAEAAPPDVLVPITTIPSNLGSWAQSSYLADYRWDWTEVLVRRKAGFDAASLGRELTSAYVASRASARAINPRVLPDSLVHPLGIAGPVKSAAGPDAGMESRVLLWVAGVALLVLAIACANVANLMLARVLRRKREITVRLALGVSRGRLVAQLVTEALLLALLGGTAGIVAAQWGGVAIRRLLLPEGSDFNLATDWRTLAVAFVCALAATLATAIGPAILATRTDLAAALKAGPREGTLGRSRARTALVVAQGAMTVVLLVGAGLFVRSVIRVEALPLGYDAHPVLEVVLDFRGFKMDSAQSAATRRRLLAAARVLPGVVGASQINSYPFSTNTGDLRIDGIDSIQALGRFNFQIVSPGYFDVMQTRILRGRAITEADRDGAQLVAVVSEAMARALWPGRDPLGRCMHVGLGEHPEATSARCTTVVGIAENSAQQDLVDDPRFMYYIAAEQFAPAGLSSMLVRVAAPDASSHLEAVRRALTREMPGDGFVVVRPLQEVVDDHMRSWRLGATLFVAFGALALAVALVGQYGAISYQVTQRMHELGVRAALGARSRDVVWLVTWQSVRTGAIAVIIGLAVASSAARWVQPLLFRQSATDPLTYSIVAAGMVFAALLASALPATRAMRADPCTALRAE